MRCCYADIPDTNLQYHNIGTFETLKNATDFAAEQLWHNTCLI